MRPNIIKKHDFSYMYSLQFHEQIERRLKLVFLIVGTEVDYSY